MQAYCVREGQVEVGVVEHEGSEYSAFGATVSGRHITGYTKHNGRDISLTSWCGKTTLASRCEVVQAYRSGADALMFRLPRNRFVVGYSLGDGMLFRGELLTDATDDEARQMARMISECFSDLDAEDEENFEQDD
jgi:hypothetical protein